MPLTATALLYTCPDMAQHQQGWYVLHPSRTLLLLTANHTLLYNQTLIHSLPEAVQHTDKMKVYLWPGLHAPCVRSRCALGGDTVRTHTTCDADQDTIP